MTGDEATDLIFDLLDAVVNEERFPARFIQHHKEKIEAMNKIAAAITSHSDEIERLQMENWQLRQACGYPIPADKETPQNPFKCGICDARAISGDRS